MARFALEGGTGGVSEYRRANVGLREHVVRRNSHQRLGHPDDRRLTELSGCDATDKLEAKPSNVRSGNGIWLVKTKKGTARFLTHASVRVQVLVAYKYGIILVAPAELLVCFNYEFSKCGIKYAFSRYKNRIQSALRPSPLTSVGVPR